MPFAFHTLFNMLFFAPRRCDGEAGFHFVHAKLKKRDSYNEKQTRFTNTFSEEITNKNNFCSRVGKCFSSWQYNTNARKEACFAAPTIIMRPDLFYIRRRRLPYSRICFAKSFHGKRKSFHLKHNLM